MKRTIGKSAPPNSGPEPAASALAVLVYLIFAFLIMLPLLGPGYYLALDMQFGPSSFLVHQFADFYGAAPSSYGAYFPLRMVMAAISDFIGNEAVEKLLLFSIVFLCGLLMHFSLPTGHGNARYFAGLLYMLNPFVFVRFLAGHWSLLLSYSIWPIALYYLQKSLENPSDRRAFASSVLLFCAAAVSSHGVIMLLLCASLLCLSHFLRRGLDAAAFRHAAILAFAILAMNLYWIAPTLAMFQSIYTPASPQTYLNDFQTGSVGMPLGATILTMHGFWRGGFFLTKDIFPFWHVPFFGIAALAFAGFVVLLRSRALHAIYLLLVLLLGFFLAMGDNGPLSFAFMIFGKDFPLYMLFRDSQKFVGMVCLSLSLLGSYGADHAMRSFPRWRPLLLALVMLIPIVYDFGIFGFFGQIRPMQYPPDWEEAGRIVSADPAPGRVLILPPYLYSTYRWSNATQKTLASPATHFFSKPIIVSQSVMTAHVYSDVKDSYGNYIMAMFKKRQHISNTAELLVPLNVRYIFLLKDSQDADSYLWLFKRKGGVANITLAYEGESAYLFRNELASGPFLASSERGDGDIESILDISTGNLSANATYEKINPVTYSITDCGGPYLFHASPPDPFSVFGGIGPSSWHGIASTYPCEGPGILGNRIFPFSLGLFILSWAAGVCLLLRPVAPVLFAISAFAVLIYAFAWLDALDPHSLGVLLLLSFAFSLAVFNYDIASKKIKTFLKLN